MAQYAITLKPYQFRPIVRNAKEGLDRMTAYMNELGLEMYIKDLGVTEDMFDGIAKGSFILKGGYKVLTHDEIVHILQESMI